MLQFLLYFFLFVDWVCWYLLALHFGNLFVLDRNLFKLKFSRFNCIFLIFNLNFLLLISQYISRVYLGQVHSSLEDKIKIRNLYGFEVVGRRKLHLLRLCCGWRALSFILFCRSSPKIAALKKGFVIFFRLKLRLVDIFGCIVAENRVQELQSGLLRFGYWLFLFWCIDKSCLFVLGLVLSLLLDLLSYTLYLVSIS